MSKKCSASVESKPCEKSSFATCDGCRQAFCLPHLNVHQQQLGTQMENIIIDHDLLREELEKDHIQPVYEIPDFARELRLIDAWETRTLAHVTKLINTEADRARNVVRTVMNENRDRVHAIETVISENFDRLKKRLTILSDQLQEKMKNNDYLEPDLHQWSTELSDIKRLSMITQAPTPMIVSKLIVGETKRVQIDVSKTLDIQYPDEESSKVSNHVNQDLRNVYNYVAENVSEAPRQKWTKNYYNNERYANDDDVSEAKGLVETMKGKAAEAYQYVAEKVTEATNTVQYDVNQDKRSTKK